MNHSDREQNGYRLPQTGWLTDKEWAKSLDITVETFRNNVQKYNIPHMTFGNMTIVQTRDFYGPHGGWHGEEAG